MTAWTGFILSCVVIAGYANALIMALLWILYMSIVHVGQEWYGYGWEIQLLETGFLSIFLCPLFDARPFPKYAPPLPVIWLFRWLTFRLMFFSGVVKLTSGDPTWRWFFGQRGWGAEETKDLSVRFDADGTVKSYAFTSNFPNDMKRLK